MLGARWLDLPAAHGANRSWNAAVCELGYERERGSSRTGTPEIHTVSTENGSKLVCMKRWIIAAFAVLVAVGLVTTATAAPGKKKAGAGAFNKVLATKLGEQLNKPADDVRVAMKSARKPVKAAEKGKKKQAWTNAVAASLKVEPKAVTDAVRALVKQRLDSLVEDGWITAEQAAKRQDKLWIPFLRLR